MLMRIKRRESVPLVEVYVRKISTVKESGVHAAVTALAAGRPLLRRAATAMHARRHHRVQRARTSAHRMRRFHALVHGSPRAARQTAAAVHLWSPNKPKIGATRACTLTKLCRCATQVKVCVRKISTVRESGALAAATALAARRPLWRRAATAMHARWHLPAHKARTSAHRMRRFRALATSSPRAARQTAAARRTL